MWQTRRTSRYGLRAALVVLCIMLAMLVAANAEEDSAQSSSTSSSDQLSLLPESEPQPELAADPLSGGVTAVATEQAASAPSPLPVPITVEPAIAPPAQAVSTAEAKPQSLTFSNRFLLGNRQDQLSLGADQPPKGKPQPAKPKANNNSAKPKPAGNPPANSKPVATPSSAPLPTISNEAEPALPVLPSGPAPPSEVVPPPAAAPATAETSLAEYFAQDDPGSDSVLGTASGVPEPEMTAELPADRNEVPVAVIATRPPAGKHEVQPSVGAILTNRDQGSLVGSGLSGFTPWRSFAIMLAMLSALLGGVWLVRKWKLPKFGVNQGTLAVIETITLSPGRQIVIVEMRDEALVLGMTPHSINLLDKVPLDDFGASYRKTVNMIIRREDQAQPADWARQPRFAAEPAIPSLSDFKSGSTYSPAGKLKTSVSELRQARASLRQPSSLLSHREPVAARAAGGTAATKTELINLARQQLLRLGE